MKFRRARTQAAAPAAAAARPEAEDPSGLARVIAENRAEINRKWQELDRLNRDLESLNARENAQRQRAALRPPALPAPSACP